MFVVWGRHCGHGSVTPNGGDGARLSKARASRQSEPHGVLEVRLSTARLCTRPWCLFFGLYGTALPDDVESDGGIKAA